MDLKKTQETMFKIGITSIILMLIVLVILFTAIKIKSKYNFKFPENTIFIKSKGIQEYSLDKIKEKILFLLSATTDKELSLFLDKTIDLKKLKNIKPKFINFIKKENIMGKNIKILNITKIYGQTKFIKGNKKIAKETNAKYKISIEVEGLKNVQDKKYITMDVTVNDRLKLVDFEYYHNKNLKEFYEALKIAKILNLKTLPNYVNDRIKNRIEVRNLFIKPSGTKFKLVDVEYNKNQIQIIVNIDNKKYILIYKKGKIVNVIKIKNKQLY